MNRKNPDSAKTLSVSCVPAELVEDMVIPLSIKCFDYIFKRGIPGQGHLP
jgi:hypothetical protein